MSRWIDADELEERSAFWIVGVKGKALDTFIKLSEVPTIDIVRCRECKHWERLNYEAPKEGWCDDQMPYSDGRWVDADDYCSYGEREGE